MERLQKIIAESGYTSRRKAEEFIKQGKVKVNGKVVDTLGTKVNENSAIEVCGDIISKQNKVYYILNKPRGVITSVSDEHGRKTVLDLIECQERIYPVGRLDYDTTGLLILTNDGEFANNLMHPRNEIDKVYVCKIEGILDPKSQMILKNGVVIDGVKTSKAKVRVRKMDKTCNTSIIEITIHEGRNHQVKKMLEAVGYKILKLKRERISFLDLTGLKSGEYRKLNPKEVKKLYAVINEK